MTLGGEAASEPDVLGASERVIQWQVQHTTQMAKLSKNAQSTMTNSDYPSIRGHPDFPFHHPQ
jgi:hypothetical protein